MSKKVVAITGAGGIVGIPTVELLLNAGFDVHALVHFQLLAGHPLLVEQVGITRMDLATVTEEEVLNWLSAERPVALIHSAAMVDVRGCERDPAQAYFMNECVTRMLARACARYQTHFILLSTEYVFGGTPHPWILHLESDTANPLNHYGRSKLKGELAVQEECSQKSAWTVCRTSMVYGSTHWNRPDFTQWVRASLHHNEMIHIATAQINSPTCAVDLARMLVIAVEQRLQGIYHMTGSTAIDRYRFALAVARTYGLDESLIRPVLTSELDLSPSRPLNAGLCVDKIRRDAGIQPYSLSTGLALCQEREEQGSSTYQLRRLKKG